MSPAHFILLVLSCIALSGGISAIYEDCQTPPPVEHARAELLENRENGINTAIYNCATGYAIKGSNELKCNVNTEEWQGDPPTCLKIKVSPVAERKKKLLSVPEELNMPSELIPKVDLSCIQAKVEAPEVNHGYVLKYERRRRGENIFLVAYYACNDNYDFEKLQANALYCSGQQWVGELPTCLPRVEYSEGEDDDYEDNDYESFESDITDDLDTETENTQNSASPDSPISLPPPPPPVAESEVQTGAKPDTIEITNSVVQPEDTTLVSADDKLIETVSEIKAEAESQAEVGTKMKSESLPESPSNSEDESHPEVSTQPDSDAIELDPEQQSEVQPSLPENSQGKSESESSSSDLEEPIEAVTDINIVVEPTKDPYTPRVLEGDCGQDRGGCAHKCERLLFPGENEPRLKCSCNEGYTLDPQDYSTCHDIDECQESNGGCSQICNNLPGSFECACEIGFQIDAQTGKTCEDINECAIPEEVSKCPNGCENTPGSYRCVLTINSKQEVEKEIEVDITVNEIGEPDGKVLNTTAEATNPDQSSCNPGFSLLAGGSECQDINECNVVIEDNDDPEHVPHRICQHLCENTIGSYRCSCRDGYHLNDDQISCAPDTCDDLDNPRLNRTRCAHECQDLPNGKYECVCPSGYVLGSDSYSCEVIEDVCSREQGHERCRPGSCIVSEDNSTFSCLCPPGYTNDVFSCQDIDECALALHNCSHDCFNTAGGYQCLCPRGMTLQEPDGYTCVAPDLCSVNNNGCEQLCLSAEAGTCACSKGYVLSDDGKSCKDVDECLVNNGGCQQLCRNVPGSYECLCFSGFEMLTQPGLSGFCFDIDECATQAHDCGPKMVCENLNGSFTCLCESGYAVGFDINIYLSSISSSSSPSSSSSSVCLDIDECSLSNGNCSHFCINLQGSYECGCPLGFKLGSDGRKCQDNNECLHKNGHCEQLCFNQDGGFSCGCNSGFELSPDGFGCLDIDECALGFVNCSGVCINLLGSHTCGCDRGYEIAADGHSCQDVDECAGLLSGGCTHECINKPGNYECGCPLGYLLQEDERTCQPALVGCPPGSHQTDLGCEPIECAFGMLLGVNGDCVDIDECKVNNGGCSHLCENSKGSFSCGCPQGHRLLPNLRECEDINECLVENGGCAEKCVNEVGSFKCSCGSGKRLAFDNHSCYNIPEIASRSKFDWHPEAERPTRPVAKFPSSSEKELPRRTLPILPKLPFHPVAQLPTRPVAQLPSRPISFLPSVPVAQLPTPTQFETRPTLPQTPVRDNCKLFEAPANGKAHCNRYRHKRRLFYNTRCKVRCNPGYRLLGSEIRSCGAFGNWEGQENKCVPIEQSHVFPIAGVSISRAPGAPCSTLPAPRNGVISPTGCTQGPSSYGSTCTLRCNMGFVPVAGIMTTCSNGWTMSSVLECKPIGANFFNSEIGTRLRSPWMTQSFPNIHNQVQRQPKAKPYIVCPEAVTILLNRFQSKAFVKLQQPASNVDYKHVAAFPAWAKHLQGHLPEGIHTIIFRAHDPLTQQTAGCQTTITVKRAVTVARPNQFESFTDFQPISLTTEKTVSYPDLRFKAATGSKQFESLIDTSPLSSRSERLIEKIPKKTDVFQSTNNAEGTRIDLGSSSSSYCPPSFEVQLKENQNLRSVKWEEPRFAGKLLKIFKSSFPGALFGVGDHIVKYEATTTDGQTLQCSFQIHVKPAGIGSTHADVSFPDEQSQRILFDNLESYVICPDKSPVKVTSKQSVNLPVGCSLKNLRQLKTQTQPKRGVLTSLWRSYNNF